MQELNEEQKKAVAHGDGCCVVTASPGSGKTKILTERVISLIKNGIPPENILCITFTNKAANEMKDRILNRTENSSSIWISTFHKFCLAILRKYGGLTKIGSSFSILDEGGQNDLIRKTARMNGIEIDLYEAMDLAKLVNDYRENLWSQNELMEKIEEFKSHKSDECKTIIFEYLKNLNFNKSIDFSGMLFTCYEILKNNESISKSLSSRFKYMLIDEMQDTNVIQYEIIKEISKHHNNLFIVGDFCQSLYGWRGACPENINKIFKDFPDVEKIFLPKNYRSTERILKAAEKLIKNNPNTDEIFLESVRGDGEDVEVLDFQFPEDEADFVCNKIMEIKNERSLNYSDFAILYRVNSLSRVLEQTLRNYELPYKISGGYSFYDRKEIKDILAYMTLVINPYDTISFHRAVSYPRRGIGDLAIGKIEKICKENNFGVFDVFEKCLDEVNLNKKANKEFSNFCKMYKNVPNDALDAVKFILKESKYLDELDRVNTEENANRKENVLSFVESVYNFCKTKKNATVQNFLYYISLESDKSEDDEDKNKIQLMTVHSAKGTETDTIFLVGVEEGLLPHYRCLNEGDLYEERRCCYVAVSRAKNRLFITYNKYRKKFDISSKGKPRLIYCKPSRFIKEMLNGQD